MILGTYDILILLIILVLNVIVLRIKAILKFKFLFISVAVVLYLIVIPYTSGRLEAMQLRKEHEMVDGFNLLYLWFRFPTYWLIGVLNLVAANFVIRRRPSNLLVTKLKKAIKISSNIPSDPIYNKGGGTDLSLALERLQIEFDNGDKDAIEKLTKIFSPASDWDNIVGNEPVRKEVLHLLNQMKEE